MRLMEMHVLTAINHNNSKFYTLKTYSKYSIAGIALIELLKAGKIKLEEEKIVVVDTTSTGDRILDDLLALMKKTESPKKLAYWLGAAQLRMKNLLNRVLESLEDNGVIRIDQVSFLGIIPMKRYVITNVFENEKKVERMKRAFLEEPENVSEEDAILVILGIACGFLKKYLTKEEFQTRKQRWKAIEKLTHYKFKDEYMLKVLKAVQKALSDAKSSGYVPISVGG